MKSFRMAFRREGEFVNAYLAPIGTMEGATLLGSIRVSVLEVGLMDDYVALMRRWMTITCKETLGAEPSHFEIEQAPEHERSGRA